MSVTFYGKKADNKPIFLEDEDPASMNISSMNAAHICGLLVLPFEDGFGEASVPEARRAIMRAKATFDRRASKFTRETSHEGRFYAQGVDEDYLFTKLNAFETFLNRVVALGAVSIYWA